VRATVFILCPLFRLPLLSFRRSLSGLSLLFLALASSSPLPPPLNSPGNQPHRSVSLFFLGSQHITETCSFFSFSKRIFSALFFLQMVQRLFSLEGSNFFSIFTAENFFPSPSLSRIISLLPLHLFYLREIRDNPAPPNYALLSCTLKPASSSLLYPYRNFTSSLSPPLLYQK